MTATAPHQIPTKLITLKQILRTAAFRRGFEDVLAGRPFQDQPDGLGGRWHYERGRLFAASGYRGPLKVGQRLHAGAILALEAAWRAKEVI